MCCNYILFSKLPRTFFILCIIFFSFITFNSEAQLSSNYTYTTNNNGSLSLDMNNNPLDMTSGTTQLIGAGIDNVLSALNPVGFDFYFMGNFTNTFTCTDNGLIQIGGTTPGNITTFYNVSFISNSHELSPLAHNLEVGTDGEVRYKLFGSAPNRVLVIEFKNMMIGALASPASGTGTFQTRLYETTGVIEYIYGSMATNSQAAASIEIGFVYNSNSTNNIISINSSHVSSSSTPFAFYNTVSNSTISQLHSVSEGLRRYYRFTPSQIAVASPINLTFNPVTASTITVNWTDNSTNETNFNVLRSTDNINFIKVSTIVSSTTGGTGGGYSQLVSGLTPGTLYYFRIVANTEGIASSPLGGSQATTSPSGYHWTGSGAAAFTDAANWLPNRNSPDPTDTLYFDNGIVSSANNISSQSIARLVVTNNTTISLQSAATATITLTNKTGNALGITSGSTLTCNSSNNLTISFSTPAASGTSSIAGTFEMAPSNTYNTTNAITTVSGKYASAVNTTGASVSTLIFSGTGIYEHKFTTTSGTIPVSNWNSGSTCLISGYTTNSSALTMAGQTFSNLTWNCPSQSGNISLGGNVPTAINGTLTIMNTNSGSFRMASTTSPTLVVNNYIQTGGTFELNTGTGSTIMRVSGTFNQTGGLFASSANSAGTPTLEFNGISGIQNINFNNAAPTSALTYKITNASGISLTGSGSFSANFNINNNAGIKISTVAAAPITSTLNIVYNSTGTTLTYDALSSRSMTSTEFPSSGGPFNITVNMPGLILSMPFTRTIGGTLTMSAGDIDVGSNSITLGTSAATTGTLTWTSGNIRVTSGSMTRWFGTTGLPATAGTGIGYFPLAGGPDNRNVSVYGSAQFSTGGSLTVSHSGTAGLTTGLSITDGGYTIQRRTNSSWTFSQSGLVASGSTIGLRITGANLFNTTNVTNIRLMQSSSVVGSHVAGSGTTPNFRAERNGLSVADITGTFYIGAADIDMDPVYIAIITGNWSDGNTWSSGTPPSISNNASIATGVIVTLDGSSQCKSLFINPGATLTASSNSLFVDSILADNGTLNISGATITVNGGLSQGQGFSTATGSVFTISSGSLSIGPSGGSNKRWTHSGGTTNINGGTLTVNGNISITGGNFNQTTGDIFIDGNDGISAISSVADGTSLFQYTGGTLSCTGGNITIVDPPFNTSTSSRAISLNSATTTTSAFAGTHTFIFGDGVSVTQGNATNGFVIDTKENGVGRMPVNNVLVNSGNATGRFVRNTIVASNGTHIRGTLTINNGSTYEIITNTSGKDCIGGNIINNGTLISTQSITFGGEAGIYAVTSPQNIGGTGVFQNSTGSPTANFSGITLNNAGGITAVSGNVSLSGILMFTSGNINVGSSTFIATAGSSIAGTPGINSHIIGNFQQHSSTGTLNLSFPIGDQTKYTPVTVNGGAGAVLISGDILAGTISTEHPGINTSGINPNKSVNRFYTLQALNGISFTANSLTVTLNWSGSDADAGSNSNNFIVGKFDNPNWTFPLITNRTPVSIQAANISGFSDFAIGEPCITTANFSYTGSPYCTNGNASPTFGSGSVAGVFTEPTGFITLDSVTGIVNLSTSVPGTYTITNTITVPGCSVVTANAIITIASTAAAGVSISTSSNPVCDGSSVTFTATPVNGGSSPFYQWKVNGVNAGTNNPVFSSSVLSDGDTVVCDFISGLTCATPNQATSNNIIMTVNANPAAPVITLLGPQTINCSDTDTLISNYPGAGNLWTPGGAVTDTIIISTGGSFTVTFTDNNGCVSPASAPVIITVNIPSTPLSGNYTIGSGQQSCTNFLSFQSAMSALNTRGVGGNVIFNVPAGYAETAPGSGLQVKMCSLTDSLRSGPARKVIFQKTGSGSNPLIMAGTGTSNLDAIIMIVGADYITFDGIDVAESVSNTNTTTQMEWGYALLKCDGTDGAQHNTIVNCNITLQKTNTSTVGIYLNNHTEVSNIALTYSGSAGGDSVFRSSYNVFYGNSISNVYNGIITSGSSTFNDSLNEIGRDSQPVNLITNFGGSSNAVTTILASNQQRIKIDNNSVNGGAGSTLTVTGISVPTASGFSGEVDNNTITLSSSSAGSNTMSGINIGTVTNGDAINITGNIVQGCTFISGTTATFSGIVNFFSGTGSSTVHNNIIQNNNFTTSSSGSFNGLSISGTPGSLLADSNSVTENNLSGTGTFSGINISTTASSVSIIGNIISNNLKTGASGTMNGATVSSPDYTFSGNTIVNDGISSSAGTTSTSVFGFNNQSSAGIENISGNIIRKLFIDGTNSGTITVSAFRNNNSAASRTITGNSIDSLYTTISATVSGINSGFANGTISLSGNKIFDLIGGGTGSTVSGIVTSLAPASIIITNNIIGDLKSPNATGTNAVRGIDIGGTPATVAIYFNTIRLNAASNNTTFGSSALNTVTASALDMRNNIFINLSIPGGSGGTGGATVAYRRSSATLTSYAGTSNNNLFYAGIPGSNNLIYCEGSSNPVSNPKQSLGDYKALTGLSPRDNVSVTENVSFLSTAGSGSSYLHINPSILTFIEGNATPVPGIITDYDGDIRNTTNPDIGADEGNFSGLGPSISSVMPVPGTGQCTATSHVMTAVVVPGINPVTAVTLNYSFNGSSPVQVSMINTAGNTWEGTIPVATPSNAVVTWTLMATDGTYSQTSAGNYEDEILTTYNLSINAGAAPYNVCGSGNSQLDADVTGAAAPLAGYCNISHTGSTNCIYDVELNTLSSNTSLPGGCALPGYTLFPQSGTTTTSLTQGQTYLLSVTNNVNSMVWVWIDFNRNGTFENSEGTIVYSAAVSGSINITVPSNAVIGGIRMRIRSTVANGVLHNSDGCPSSPATTGETEDYIINIIPPLTYDWTPLTGLSNPNIFNPVASVSSAVTYTVSARDIYGCTLPALTETLNISVTAPPNAPSNPVNSTQCGSGIPLCAVTSGGGTLSWYLTSSGGSPLPGENGEMLSAYSINSTTHFWVTEFDGTCESSRTEVIAFVNQPDSVIASASASLSCYNNPLILTATKLGSVYTYVYSWSASPSAGSGISGSVSGQLIVINPTAAGIYTYYVTATDTNLNCYTIVSVVVTITDPPVLSSITSSALSVCSGSNDTLTALTALPGFVTIGTGNLHNSSVGGFPTPYAGYYGGTRSQYIIPAGELTAAGLYQGQISSLAFSISSLSGVATYDGFTIKLGNSNAVSLGGNFESSPVTQVYGPVNYTPVVGINTHNFSTPFFWDGVSGILVEVCFNNNSNVTLAGNVVCNSTATAYSSAIYFGGNLSSTVCFNAASFAAQTQRPNMIFGGQVNSAGNSSLSWIWNPGNLTGNSVVVSPVVSTVYSVTLTNNITSCTASSSIAVNVYPLPPAPVAHDSSHCGTAVPNCSVIGSGGFLHWYLTPSGGTFLPGESGSTLTSYSTGASTTFYVAEFDGTCESPRTAVHESVVNPDSVAASVSPGPYCAGSPVVLTATQFGTSYSYSFTWNADPATGSGIPSPVNGQAISVLPTASGIYSYTVTAADGNCFAVSIVTITINDIPVITSATINKTDMCAGESVTLTAQSFSVSSPNAIIGTGSVQNGTSAFPSPYGHAAASGGKEQYLILASELSASGLQPGNISSLSFDIVSLPTVGGNNFQNFSISMGITNLSSLPSAIQPGITGMTQVIYYPVYTISTGINTHTFTTPFFWNGTSNLLVEVCFNDIGTWPGGTNAVVRQTATGFVSAIEYHRTNSNDICTNVGGSAISSFSQRPNMLLGGLVGTDITSSLTWNWNPGNLNGATVSTTSFTTGLNTFSVTATNLNGCTSTSSADVTVNPVPSEPMAHDSSHCGNAVPLCSVTGSGGLYRWYLFSTGGTAIAGEVNTSLVSHTVSSTTTFYVAEFDGNCESQRTAVVETVTPADSVYVTSSVSSVCQGTSITLTANQTGNTNNYSFSWSSVPGGGLISSAGNPVTASPSVSGLLNYKVVATDNNSGCSWISEININSGLIPIVSVTPSIDTICFGSSVNLSSAVNLSGNALQLNGINQYVSIPSSASLDLITNFTIEAWIRPSALGDGDGIINKNQSVPNGSYFLRVGSVSPYTGLNSGGVSQIVSPLGTLSSNTWYHIAAVFTNLSGNNNSVTIYVNGSTIVSGQTVVLSNSDSLRIGVEYGGKFFDGMMDEIRIWNTALSQSVIQSWKNEPVNNLHPAFLNLKAYYDFNFPTGSVVYDNSGNGNNGTLMNGAAIISSDAPVNGGFIYSWIPSADLNNATISNPVATPVTQGVNNYVVTVTAPNGCTATASSSVFATSTHQVPLITSSVSPADFCNSGSGLLVLLNPRNGNSIQWQSSPDSINWTDILNANSVSYSTGIVSSTTYFRVIVSCSVSDTSNIIIYHVDVPTITSVTGGSRCGTGTVTLNVSGNGIFDWYLNSSGGTSIFTGPVYQPLVSSSITFWVEAHIGSCLYSGGRQPEIASVTTPPALNTNATALTICQGQSTTLNVNSSNDPNYSYQWTPGYFNGASLTVSPASSSTYTITASDTSGGINNGCVSINTINISVNPSPASPIINPSSPNICAIGNSVTLSVTNVAGTAAYLWNPGSHNGTSFTVSPAVTTSYTVTAAFPSGCTSSSSVTVTYDPVNPPSITPGGPTTFCQGGNVLLDAGSGYVNYLWSDGSNTVGTSQIFTASPTVTTMYTVTVSNGGVCTAGKTQVVTIQPLNPPTITVVNNDPTTFCQGDSAVLDAGPGYLLYSWSDGSGIVGSGQTYTATAGETYDVTVTASNGCTSGSSVVITVNLLPPPAVITPGGPIDLCDDGSNSPISLIADTTGTGSGGIISWNDNIFGTTGNQYDVYYNDPNITGNTYNFYVTVINANGCSNTSNSVTVNIIPCAVNVTLTDTMLIEGYYIGGGLMNACLFNNGINPYTSTDADSVFISAMDPITYAQADRQFGILQTNGIVTVTFGPAVVAGNSYYIRVQHRNSIETWSANPVLMNAVASYDFTSGINQAYGTVINGIDAMIDVGIVFSEPPKWAFFSGDISDAILGHGIQDGIIESQDYGDMENAVNIIASGYIPEDITGDAIVESADYSIMENNVNAIRFTQHP